MQTMATSKVIDLSAHFIQIRCDRRRRQMHTVFALWTQYLSLAALLLYGLLRLTLCADVALGRYSGPLAVLWPIAFVLLLTSYVSDLLLWREE